MDSFTQIVLGAACGEAVAGKKMRNRAMLWGAVGGTIPDLDVLINFFTDDEISAVSFHRGIMHSFLFAVIVPWLLAWWMQHRYRRRVAKRPDLSYMAEVPYRTWVALWFWSIFTHPILDCFTHWGTQVFVPFSYMRVQWSTVSVVDPLATLPFFACLIVAASLKRDNPRRSIWNWIGIAYFCAYLGYTVWHKSIITRTFEETLQASHIPFKGIYTNPTIFNNIAWHGVADADTCYYFGMYSFNDRHPKFELSRLPKQQYLLNHIDPNDRSMEFIRWFSEGYYNVIPWNGDTLQVNDLRFGLLGGSLKDNNYVFPFLLYRNPEGQWTIHQNNRNNENMDKAKAAMGELWEIVKGREN